LSGANEVRSKTHTWDPPSGGLEPAQNGSTGLDASTSFKAYEIEELADVYFFRPLGMIAAEAARAFHLTPTIVTVLAGLVGAAGGALLYYPRLASIGFGLIITHSVLDSADGQLARMTGRESELGRLLDGIAGFVTHGAIYVALIAASLANGAAAGPLGLIVVAAVVSNIAHAQLYDYHRSTYARVAIKGLAKDLKVRDTEGASRFIDVYESIERMLAGTHPRVEDAIAKRSIDGRVRTEDRIRYRATFYWPVRGWNVLGDNTRFYAVGVLAWLQRLDAFFLFVLIPMNVALLALWLWQARADRQFLAGL
jgi:phosphatidylglycerophosphate synthase